MVVASVAGVSVADIMAGVKVMLFASVLAFAASLSSTKNACIGATVPFVLSSSKSTSGVPTEASGAPFANVQYLGANTSSFAFKKTSIFRYVMNGFPTKKWVPSPSTSLSNVSVYLPSVNSTNLPESVLSNPSPLRKEDLASYAYSVSAFGRRTKAVSVPSVVGTSSTLR